MNQLSRKEEIMTKQKKKKTVKRINLKRFGHYLQVDLPHSVPPTK